MAKDVAASLRAQAAALERLSARLRRSGLAGADELQERAREAIEVAAEIEALTGGDMPRKLPHMEQAAEQRARRAGRPVESKHPFPLALEAAGSSVEAWAESHGLKRNRVASWYATGPHGRAIPARYAAELERTHGIPQSAWPKGVRN